MSSFFIKHLKKYNESRSRRGEGGLLVAYCLLKVKANRKPKEIEIVLKYTKPGLMTDLV